MKFRFSIVVDPSTYETQGLCDGYEVRYNKNSEIEDKECLRCHADWRKFVGPLGVYKGGLGHPWNGMSISTPEALPDRLGIVAYAYEFAFLHDDKHNDDLQAGFEQAVSTGTIKNAASGKRALQAYIARKMLSIDKNRAITSLKAWSRFLDKAGRKEDYEFKSKDEYLKYRIQDVGMLFWYGIVTFATAITIPEDEVDTCHQLATTAYLHMALVNDLVSWEKERQNTLALGKDYCTNYIFVVMKEHGISEDMAHDQCRQEIKKAAAEYREIFDSTKASNTISDDGVRYLESCLYCMSGNVVWGLSSPRYHAKGSFSERQMKWMKDGIPQDSKSAADDGLFCGLDGVNKSMPTPNGHLSNGLEDDKGLLSAVIKEYLTGHGTFKLGDHEFCTEPSKQQGFDTKVLQAPFEYIASLPSKRVREQAIDALNIWLQVPAEKLEVIKSITRILHNASLMLDDLEDESTLRRGKPATHTIFGASQTINSANYQLIRALQHISELDVSESLHIFIEELQNLYIGQSMDLYWTSNVICPSVDEYLHMIEHKTGGLFRLFSRLMCFHSTNHAEADLTTLSKCLGRYFQIRDDYQNLVSAEYTKQKGFCEDLDEGKFSLPIIHLLQSLPDNDVIRNLWMQRRVHRTATQAQKQIILDLMKDRGSLEFTLTIMNATYEKVEREIGEVESKFGKGNSDLRLLLELLHHG
ncbi:putative geranylgeranyl diphosphate synthase [Aspergillus venezuelensis]